MGEEEEEEVVVEDPAPAAEAAAAATGVPWRPPCGSGAAAIALATLRPQPLQQRWWRCIILLVYKSE